MYVKSLKKLVAGGAATVALVGLSAVGVTAPAQQAQAAVAFNTVENAGGMQIWVGGNWNGNWGATPYHSIVDWYTYVNTYGSVTLQPGWNNRGIVDDVDAIGAPVNWYDKYCHTWYWKWGIVSVTNMNVYYGWQSPIEIPRRTFLKVPSFDRIKGVTNCSYSS